MEKKRNNKIADEEKKRKEKEIKKQKRKRKKKKEKLRNVKKKKITEGIKEYKVRQSMIQIAIALVELQGDGYLYVGLAKGEREAHA